MYKRLVAGCGCLLLLVIGVYVKYIHHGSADDILAANKARRTVLSGHRARLIGGGKQLAAADDDYDYYDDYENDPIKKALWKWDSFIVQNNYVSIGEFYDKCEGEDRLMIGRTVLMKDDEGGLKSLSFINFTLPEDVTSGLMYFECKYNGQDFYANHWDLCTVEDNMSSPKMIYCPVAGGKKRLIKHLSVPSYVPKGTYTIKSWLLDQNDRLFVCSFSEFTI